MKKLFLINMVLALALLWGGVAAAADDFLGVANGYFSAGAKNISAKDLYDVLNDGDPSTDPYLIDTRPTDLFANAHIKGARNIAIPDLFKPDVLATLPKDKKIVVSCFTGQNSSQVVPVLNMLGYDAWNLLFGFGGWTQNKDAYVNRFDPATVPDYATTTETFAATETYALPTPLAATIAAAAQANFAAGTKMISARDLFSLLNDGDPSTDPFIMDVRNTVDHYNGGHINGAVYFDPKTLFQTGNIGKLPTDKQIVVYCYTGQISGQIVGALRIMGYDATSLTHGIGGWTNDAAVYVNRFNPATSQDYPFVGTLAEAAVAEEEEEEEATPTPEPVATPAALPVTGAAFPVPALILGAGAVSLALGLALRRRNSA